MSFIQIYLHLPDVDHLHHKCIVGCMSSRVMMEGDVTKEWFSIMKVDVISISYAMRLRSQYCDIAYHHKGIATSSCDEVRHSLELRIRNDTFLRNYVDNICPPSQSVVEALNFQVNNIKIVLAAFQIHLI